MQYVYTVEFSKIFNNWSLFLDDENKDLFAFNLFDFKNLSAAEAFIPKLIPSVWSFAKPDTAIATSSINSPNEFVINNNKKSNEYINFFIDQIYNTKFYYYKLCFER